MCGIMITTQHRYDGSMKHRGVITRELKIGKLKFIHEHLPIQATVTDDSIINCKNHIVLFNGELFNIPEGFDNDLDYIKWVWENFPYDSDRIAQIYDMDGFFSILAYNKRSGDIVAFTDPLGKKQLYYSKEGIASEIKALYHDWHHPDKLFKSHTIKFGYVTDDSTPHQEIKRIMPNKVYRFSASLHLLDVSEESVFDFSPTRYDLTKAGRHHTIRRLIDKAVKNRLAGHEKIGLLLSGGLDSSIIYYHAKKAGYDVTTYCVNNKEDLEFAAMVDQDVIPIPPITPTPLGYHPSLGAMEMPVDLGSMAAQYELFNSVVQTVILTGDGADEVFGGYRRTKTYDSQHSDIFDELPFYHNIRLDRMSMIHTKEARSPFMSLEVVRYAMTLPYEERIDKMALRQAYAGILPDEIIWRGKEPLKSDKVRRLDPVEYRAELYKRWEELK